ncbi:hypothetical protein G6L37_03995 [Agrobacterium rubi]|nr:hypothetical protein [Agrobacterium rubi]NTF24512.1 hypothetical protein [Agrobacterium rubi]
MNSVLKNIAFLPLAAVMLLGATALTPAHAASSSTLPTIAFNTQTGIDASAADIQNTWTALQTMGTDKFVGGVIGGFKLDESSLIAAAMSIGSTELDNFLRSGSLNSAIPNVGDVLSNVMTSGAGIDLSSVVGSFTNGGGSLTSASLLSGGGVGTAGGQCDPSVASDLANQGLQKVTDTVSIGMSSEYGFSKMAEMTGSGASGGFASMGCLDKLFQNTGTDIMFKPPTMGQLTNMLQNWTCPKVPGVASQIAGAFGNNDRFQTASLGGFFPLTTYGEANDGLKPQAPGLGNGIAALFGDAFASTTTPKASDIAEMTSLGSLFK